MISSDKSAPALSKQFIQEEIWDLHRWLASYTLLTTFGVHCRVYRERAEPDLSELGICPCGQLQHRWIERNCHVLCDPAFRARSGSSVPGHSCLRYKITTSRSLVSRRAASTARWCRPTPGYFRTASRAWWSWPRRILPSVSSLLTSRRWRGSAKRSTLPQPRGLPAGMLVGFILRGKYLFGSPTSSLILSEVIRSRHRFYEERHAPFEDAHVCFDVLRTWNFGSYTRFLPTYVVITSRCFPRIRGFGFLLSSRSCRS